MVWFIISMWSMTSGRDSFSTTIKILDENDNVLSITTLTRNNDNNAGYRSNTHTYTDTATHNRYRCSENGTGNGKV